MFAILNAENVVVATVSHQPNIDDEKAQGRKVVETDLPVEPSWIYESGFFRAPKSPEPTEAELTQQRIAQIQQQLTANDLASVRPLRAKLAGTVTPEDDARLAELEEQAQVLRAELAELRA